MTQVLLVDDDKDILKFVKMLLETKDYAVTTCIDAHEAVEKLQQMPFDVVLTDANMPGHSGFDLIKTIRGLPDRKSAAIAMLTARRDRKDVERALEMGADDYIVKPIDPEILFHKLEELQRKVPQKPRPEVHFASVPTHFPMSSTLNVELETISEVGLSFTSPAFYESGTKINLQGVLFERIGITSPHLKVVQCQPVEKANDELFRTWVTFIGLSEADLQKIRSWVYMYANRRAS